MRHALRSTLAAALLVCAAAALSPPGANATPLEPRVSIMPELQVVAMQYQVLPAAVVLGQYVVAGQLQQLTTAVASAHVVNLAEVPSVSAHQLRDVEVPPGGLSTRLHQVDTLNDMYLLSGALRSPPLMNVALHRTQHRSRLPISAPPLIDARS
jgi:hypothetical protein